MGSADRLGVSRFITTASIYAYWKSYDIALVKLGAIVAFTANIKPIRLPTLSQKLASFEGQAVVQGYGSNRRVLQYGFVNILPPVSVCGIDQSICSIGTNSVTRLEPGDSGKKIDESFIIC